MSRPLPPSSAALVDPKGRGTTAFLLWLADINSRKRDVLTVAGLPLAGTSTGQSYMVSDATAVTFWTIVAGGGANTVPVTSDGTNWRIG